MAQSRAESALEINNYGKYINQFPPNTTIAIRQYERINKKICRQKMSIIFHEICIYIYIYMGVCVCVWGVDVCVCVCGWVCMCACVCMCVCVYEVDGFVCACVCVDGCV